MSMFGDIAVVVEMENLLMYMDKISKKTPEEQLKLIRKRIRDFIKEGEGDIDPWRCPF